MLTQTLKMYLGKTGESPTDELGRKGSAPVEHMQNRRRAGYNVASPAVCRRAGQGCGPPPAPPPPPQAADCPQ